MIARRRTDVVSAAFVVVALVAPLIAQSVAIDTSGGTIRVRTSSVGAIDGNVLDRLRDGQSLRLELTLAVLDDPRGAVVAETTQTFNVSFDLWEERFAVTRLGTPPRSVSHLGARDAEAWCLANLAVPLDELGRLGRGASFWIRLEYAAPDVLTEPGAGPDDAFTLRRLIDVLSRRPRNVSSGKSIVAGPFRLSN